MPDQPPSDRFKSEMPVIPGVARPGLPRPSSNPAAKLVIGLLAVLLVVFLGARWALRPKHADPPPTDQQPQLEVPSPAPDPSTLQPHATESNPGIADATEMARPWSSKEFYIRNGLTGENIPALLVRLPTGSPSQASGYWAFARKSPFENGHPSREFLGAWGDRAGIRSSPTPRGRTQNARQGHSRRARRVIFRTQFL